MTGYEVWLRSSPPRYSPATRIRNRQPDPASSSIASINGVLNQSLLRDQHRKLNWCSFQVPSSDELIEDDTCEGIPTYPVPDQNDGFTIVRRYLYDVLTSTGWGISDKYPAAIRATVEGWYGNGGYFKTLCAAENGLSKLCPEKGRTDEGKEVGFHEKSRALISSCVRHETGLLLHREADLEDMISEADTYVDGNIPDIIAQKEASLLQQNREEGTHPAFRTSLEPNKDLATAPNQDQIDDSNSSETLEYLGNSTKSSQIVQLDAQDNEELASSYSDLTTPKLRSKTPSQITHDITVQIYEPKDEQLKKQVRRLESASIISGVDAGRKSVAAHATSSHKIASTSEPLSGLSCSEEQLSGHKHARCNSNLPIKNPARVEPQINRKRSTKADKQISRTPLSTTSSISSIKSTRYETLPTSQLPSTEDTLLVDVATAAANKAQTLALNVDEARQLNHHERKAERKRGNIFARVFGRLGGKKR